MAVRFDGFTQGYYNASLGGLTKGLTWCGFVNPGDQGGANFKAVVAFGAAPGGLDYHLIFYIWKGGDNVYHFLLSIDDENPDLAPLLDIGPNNGPPTPQWYFVALTEVLDPTIGKNTVRAFAKAVGAPACASSAAVPNGSNNNPITAMLIGTDVFGEFGVSKQCGHKVWNHVLSDGEIERESRAIRAVKRQGLMAEYPLLYPEFRDYSGNGNTLALNPSSPGTLVEPTKADSPNIPIYYFPSPVYYVPMDPYHPQGSGLVVLDNVTGDQTVTMPENFTAGSTGVVLLAVFVATDPGTGTLAVTIDGVPAIKKQSVVDGGVGLSVAEIWVAEGLPGSSATVVITCASQTYMSGSAEEFRGLASPAYDTGNTNSGTGTGPQTVTVTSPTWSQDYMVVVAVTANASGIKPALVTNPGFPWVGLFGESNGEAHQVGQGSYEVDIDASPTTATWVVDQGISAPGWAAAIAGLRIAGFAPSAPGIDTSDEDLIFAGFDF